MSIRNVPVRVFSIDFYTHSSFCLVVLAWRQAAVYAGPRPRIIPSFCLTRFICVLSAWAGDSLAVPHGFITFAANTVIPLSPEEQTAKAIETNGKKVKPPIVDDNWSVLLCIPAVTEADGKPANTHEDHWHVLLTRFVFL